MDDKDKKIHDLKFELRLHRRRIDVLEEHLIKLNKTISDILVTQHIQLNVINTIIQDISEIKEEKK